MYQLIDFNMAWKQLAAFISLTHFFILSFCAVQFHYRTPPETVLTADDGARIRGFQDRNADIILGGLFPVHSTIPASNGGQCTDAIWDQGIETLEAMLYAIDAINSDPDLLPNITLGYDIRDTCQSEKIGLDESADMVLANDLESCPGNSDKTLPAVMAVIGPMRSGVSIPIASFFRVFQVPQISYASSSSKLNNRVTYSYFFRTKLPTNSLVQAIVDIIVHYKWDLVSVIFSRSLYGESLSTHFRQLAKEKDICLDFVQSIYNNFTQPEYHDIVKELMTSHAKVVLLFTITDHTDPFMRELKNVHDAGKDKKKFLWMTVETNVKTVSKFKEIVAGMWGVVSFSKLDKSFESYYSELLVESNVRNPWFMDFYQQKFDCSVGKNCSNINITAHPDYKQSIFVPLVIDAVYSVVHAIHNSIMDNCPQPVVWHPNNHTCRGQSNTISGEMLANYLYKVNFTSPTGNAIQFDESGNVEGKFNILNYQETQPCLDCNKTYQLVPVAHWDSTATNCPCFHPSETPQFGPWGDVPLESHCQKCSPGFIKRLVVSSCCAVCGPCLGPNYTNSTSSTECQMCPVHMWGNRPVNGSTDCVDIEESYLKPSDRWAIILMIVAIIGLLAAAFVVGVFIWFWNTPIVKSSGREQMTLLLTGITLCFLITIAFLIKPSPAVCGLQRIGSWFCISLILCALFVKLVRIIRIFMQGKISPVRPKCIAPEHQILFTFLLIGTNMLLVVISLSVVPPSVSKTLQKNITNQDDYPVIVIQCTSPHIALVVLQMVYFTALTIASNALAILTIQFPQNFKEAKYVAFSTFALSLIWIFVFIPSYIATANSNIHRAVISFTIQLSALAVLLCLFGPRVLIMIVWPQRNVQESPTAINSTIHHETKTQITAQPSEMQLEIEQAKTQDS